MNTSVQYLHLTGGGSYHSPDKPRKLDYCQAVFSAQLPSQLIRPCVKAFRGADSGGYLGGNVSTAKLMHVDKTEKLKSF